MRLIILLETGSGEASHMCTCMLSPKDHTIVLHVPPFIPEHYTSLESFYFDSTCTCTCILHGSIYTMSPGSQIQ